MTTLMASMLYYNVIVGMDYVYRTTLASALSLVLFLTFVSSVVLYAAESSLYTPAVTDSYVLESSDAASSK